MIGESGGLLEWNQYARDSNAAGFESEVSPPSYVFVEFSAEGRAPLPNPARRL